MLSWFKRRRRQKLSAEGFPPEWETILTRNMPRFLHLDADEQLRLKHDLRIFAAEKNWEGCGGLSMSDEIKVTISAQACYLLLNLEHDYFSRVLSILVYPTQYAVPMKRRNPDFPELVEEGEQGHLGEAWYQGPVILSWEDILYDSQHPGNGSNLVHHEFAHQLDMLNRDIDGTPPLDSANQYQHWHDVMTAEYEQLIADVEDGHDTLLDPYGTTSEAEFFAVATEAFFDLPIELKDEHPELYELLEEYFHQDPAARLERTREQS